MQLYRKMRLIDKCADIEGPISAHALWGKSTLGSNTVVLKAARELAKYRKAVWFLGIVPDTREEVDRFVEEKLRRFSPEAQNDLPCWSPEQLGFLTWDEIRSNLDKLDEQTRTKEWSRTMACFEWNHEQIYQSSREIVDRSRSLKIGDVSELGSEKVIVVGPGQKTTRVIPLENSGDFFPKSSAPRTTRLRRTDQPSYAGLLRGRKPLAGQTYYPGTEEAHTNPTRQRGECLRALAGASG